ncbi:hypothetical protein D3C73_1414750 [compost metagenome]
MISPGHKTGIPGGYAIKNSALILPTASSRSKVSFLELNAALGFTFISGISGISKKSGFMLLFSECSLEISFKASTKLFKASSVSPKEPTARTL